MKAHVYNGRLYYYCPGCEHSHSVCIDGTNPAGKNWSFDGNLEAPTIEPSVRSFMPAHSRTVDGQTKQYAEKTICHHFLRGGVIQYLDDSGGHQLRGFVDLPHYPSGYGLPGGVIAP